MSLFSTSFPGDFDLLENHRLQETEKKDQGMKERQQEK